MLSSRLAGNYINSTNTTVKSSLHATMAEGYRWSQEPPSQSSPPPCPSAWFFWCDSVNNNNNGQTVLWELHEWFFFLCWNFFYVLIRMNINCLQIMVTIHWLKPTMNSLFQHTSTFYPILLRQNLMTKNSAETRMRSKNASTSSKLVNTVFSYEVRAITLDSSHKFINWGIKVFQVFPSVTERSTSSSRAIWVSSLARFIWLLNNFISQN